MLKRLCLIFMAIAFVMFALPAASDGGGGYRAPAEMSVTVGIDTSILDQAVPGALADTVGVTPEATFMVPDGGEAAVARSTGNFWEDLGLYGYCISEDPTDPAPFYDLDAYSLKDPGRTGSAGESLRI